MKARRAACCCAGPSSTCRNAEPRTRRKLRHAYDDLLHQYGHRLESIVDCGPGMPAEDRHARTMANVILETVRIEREELLNLRDAGRMDDSVYRTLQRELDLSESRFASSSL